ncbi:MAG: hypothetical protein LBD21_10855 [Tannerellaceae bacterium]|jgi:hypothetical protein|nr:hypothetical protein [Tannerellaceae bacterium]
MKNFTITIILCGMLAILTGASGPVYEWGEYTPVFMNKADLENSVSYSPGARAMKDPGKIYYKAPYIFVNERYKGVHVINNSNPANPVAEGFIIAPGCLDMAVKENILYIDNAVDLVAFDLNAKQLTQRLRDVFPTPPSPAGALYYNDPSQTDKVLVGWKKR